MLEMMTSAQISEWQAYDKIEPIGNVTRDYHVAQLTSVIMNIANAIWAKKGSSPEKTKPIDFMPWADKPPKKPQTVDDMKRVLLSLAGSKKR